jgi:putative transcriptional regulator
MERATTSVSPTASYLQGHMLIAMPSMEDERFKRRVVYMCAHSHEGAMGLVINQPTEAITFSELLTQLKIIGDEGGETMAVSSPHLPILSGGPVDTGRGFVLHSPDYKDEESTVEINDHISLTANVEILRALTRGEGPRQALLALGYAGWSSGQLELELKQNAWLVAPAQADLVFDQDFNGKYVKSLRSLGVDPAKLSSAIGRA